MAVLVLRRLSVPFLVVAIAIALLALSSGDSSEAQWVPNTPQYQPIWDIKTCNDLDSDFNGPPELQGGGGTCVPDTSPGGHPDTTVPFTVPRGHMNYDTGFTIVASGSVGSRLDGSQVGGPNPDGTGAAAGGLQSTSSLGMGANPCGSTIISHYIWWEAEWDVTDTVACQPENASARFDPLMNDGGDPYPGQADADSPVVTKIPDCVLEMFDPDGDGIDTDGNPATIGDQPVQPSYRIAGGTQVPPGGDYQMLQNFEFAPGDLQAAFLANPKTTKHNFTKLDPAVGYITMTILNAPGSKTLQPNPISDFCSVLGSKGLTLGRVDTDGNGSLETNRSTMPTTPGSYQYQMRNQSLRDADGDGIENQFDTCAWASNTDDPYQTAGADIDMLDPVCDPDPNNPAPQFDEDGDGYVNSQDYCPQVANPLPGGETDSEVDEDYNVAAPDGGPGSDGIGDDCDGTVSPENPGGLGSMLVTDGLFFGSTHVDSVVITGGSVVDADGDGWGSDMDPADADTYDGTASEDGAGPDTCSDGIDNPPADGLVDRWDEDCNPNLGIPGQMTTVKVDITATYDPTNDEDSAGAATCNDTIDNGSDGFTDIADPDCHDQVGGWDSDGDGYSTMLEWTFIGTDPASECPVFPGGHDAWPSDMDNDGTANLLDLLPFKVSFNAQQGDANYNSRVDLDPVGAGTVYKVNLLDLLPFKVHFNVDCTALPLP